MITLMGKPGQDLFLFLLAWFSAEAFFFQLFHETGNLSNNCLILFYFFGSQGISAETLFIFSA